MKCQEIMTSSPVCCLPGDSVTTAANLMKRDDIGPVLIVSDRNDQRLLGIVTDRDLAIKVLAEGRDARTTRIDEVMTRNPVCCNESDDTSRALSLMSAHQVRRIPVVDSENRLKGIVAQADLARHEDERKVGQAVEDISAPGPSSFGRSFSDGASHWQHATGNLAIGAICMSLGAGLMYMLDPTRGSVRRNRIQDRGSSLYSAAHDALEKGTKDLSQRASDLGHRASEFAHSLPGRSSHDAPVSDRKLVHQVQSTIGQVLGRKGKIQVTAKDGNVTLSGPIHSHEVRNLLDSVTGMTNVRSIDNRLDVHDHFDESHETRSRAMGPLSPAMMAGLASGLVLFGIGSKARRGAYHE